MRAKKTKSFAHGLLMLLSVILVLSCSACLPQENQVAPVTQLPFGIEEPAGAGSASSYTVPYDWSCLSQKNGRFSYSKGWVPASLTGIDVSEHQGWIDWEAVATDGIDFAIIRLGNRGYSAGDLYLDDYFYSNVEGARNAGIKVGVYFFSQSISRLEALHEAKLVIRALEGIPLDYPVFFDHEPVDDTMGRANSISSRQLTQNAQAFCEYIENNGYVAMLYGNKKTIEKIDAKVRDRYGVWFAEYGVLIPSASFDFAIWQYSSSGVVAGIETRVDMNIHFLYP